MSCRDDDIFSRAEARFRQKVDAQNEAINWAQIRAEALRRGDYTTARDALINIEGIRGPGSVFWIDMKAQADRAGDYDLSGVARRMANEAARDFRSGNFAF